jgi:hypothetical protein
MSEYFVLKSFGPPDGEYATLGPPPRIAGVDSWLLGARFAAPIPNPIRMTWSTESEGPRLKVYDATIPLWHGDVLAALAAAGVDNLDVYPAEITDPRDGSVTREWSAVNVLGAVAAADMARSRFVAHGAPALIDVDFDSLVLDPEKTRDLPLFRLAECVTTILVHADVKRALEAERGFGLAFLAPADWSS